ncbi:TLC ATP/ADP transporter [Ordospora pajunii]|uniref:TLC ATP/ADP transporter n=1 Tax=Ordospora pajunii TaxID=3039483 RepID=UPI0029526A3B|nr:TLC ATP/ADP transporter [Ordospora pajunii]KAH9411492.1 TLC ATP/ADP transporter [Ordospora pajunii]
MGAGMTSPIVQAADKNENVMSLKTEDEIEQEACSGKIWPATRIRIASCEWKLWGSMAAIFAIQVYVYSFARILKDSFVASRQLPVAISYLKTCVVLPVSIIATGVVQKMLMKNSISKVFDYTLICFAMVFLLVGAVGFPFSYWLQPSMYRSRDVFADEKMSCKGFEFLFAISLILNEWLTSLVYLVAELFGSLIVQFMFLAFANEVLTVRQSLRFTPLFYIMSNICLILSGGTGKTYQSKSREWNYEQKSFATNSFFVLFGGLTGISYLIKKYMENGILKKQLFIRTEGVKKKVGKKSAASFSESIKLMAQSKFLIAMVFNALFYYSGTNWIESSWKNGLTVAAEAKNKNKGDYMSDLMSGEQLIVGALVAFVLLTPIATLVQTHGWAMMAIVPPIVAMISAIVVFGSAFYNYPNGSTYKPILFSSVFKGYTPNFDIETKWGMYCVSGMKIAKYAFYDIAKEAISLQIDPLYRARLKAVYDGLSGKLGKSIGAFYAMFWSFMGYNDVRAAAPFTLSIFGVIFPIWIYMIMYLNKSYSNSVQTSTFIGLDLISEKKEQL